MDYSEVGRVLEKKVGDYKGRRGFLGGAGGVRELDHFINHSKA